LEQIVSLVLFSLTHLGTQDTPDNKTLVVFSMFSPNVLFIIIPLDKVVVPDLSVSGDNFDLVEDDPHDPTTTSEPEAPMQSLNQLPVVTDLVDARSA
jgi:hypothetical protein